MTMPVKRPKRKLLLLRSKRASDYWSYCDEMGDEWCDMWNAVSEKFDTAAILTLPQNLMKEGYGNIASGIEVPFDYEGKIPENCEAISLEPCEMIYFQSSDCQTYVGSLISPAETSYISGLGYEFVDNLAPKFNFGYSEEDNGKLKLAIPVHKIS